MKKMKRILSAFLAMVLTFGFSVPVFAAYGKDLENAIQTAAVYLQKNVKEPQISSIGGEWTVIGLARSNADVPDAYFKTYYENVTETVKDKKGILHGKKYTEYSRVALALAAIGADPSDVGGYDLLELLADFEKVTAQGINGPVWALSALNSGAYGTEDIRQKYVEVILSGQLADDFRSDVLLLSEMDSESR